MAEVRRPGLPSSITGLFIDPVARGALLAGSVALIAAAMDPQIWTPTLPSIQEAIRENPQFETLVLLASVAASGLILLGGAVGNSRRAKPVILGWSRASSCSRAFVTLLVPVGPLFWTARLIGHAGSAFVIPVAIALVATSYRGAVRATAIGVAYSAFGAGGAAASILLRAVPGEQWPAMLAAIAICAIAIRLAWTRTLELRRPSQAERPLVVGVAVWAFGIITITVGVTWIGGSLDNPLRWAMIIGGSALVVGYHRLSRARTASLALIIRRRVAIALFVGITIAISETAAVLNLPLYFHLVLRYEPLLAAVAVVPLSGALLLAGPVAGVLLKRVAPRWLVGGGVIFVGIGNLVLAAVATESASYRRLHPPVPADRRRVRRGDDRPDGHHLRQPSGRVAGVGGSTERVVDLGRTADRDRARQRHRRAGGHRVPTRPRSQSCRRPMRRRRSLPSERSWWPSALRRSRRWRRRSRLPTSGHISTRTRRA